MRATSPYVAKLHSAWNRLFAFFRNMAWCVCHFQIDDSVEVVPNNWITSESQCVWPLTTTSS